MQGLAAIVLSVLQTAPFDLADGDRVLLLGNGFAEREARDGHIEAALARRFPGRRLSFRNLAWSGDAVDRRLRPAGFPPLQAWLDELKPTVILAAYGMNESFDGERGLDAFARGLSAHLDELARTKARIVLLSPIPHESLGPPFADPAEHNRNLRLYTEAMRRVSAEKRVRFVDLSGLKGRGERRLTENGIHLSAHGYAVAAAAIEESLGLAPPAWRVELDASTLEAKAAGTNVSGFSGLKFRATDDLLPRAGDTRILQVRGLASGRYALRIDGAEVAAASAEEWARGVTFSRGPAFDRAESMRRGLVEKNDLFFHRWRPQNAEYIYGTRSRAQGANVGNPQFASEFRYQESLVAEKELEAGRLAIPPSHSYEFVRE